MFWLRLFSGVLLAAPTTVAGFSGVASARTNETFPPSLARLDGGGFLTPESLSGRPTMLLFWDDDCAPCRLELADLSAMRASAPEMHFVLVVMRTTPRARKHLRPAERDGAILVRAPGDPRSLLRRLENRSGALPFSATYRADRSLCLTHLGRMDEIRAKKTAAECS